MAGMLPGVECARRRRFHQGGSSESSSSSRRSSFCLYTTSHDHTHLNSISTNFKQRSGLALGSIAREAKERLDERLRAQTTSEIKRYKSMGSIKINEKNGSSSGSGVHREVFCSKKSSRKFSWMKKLGWKSYAEEDHECVVCLEEFKRGDILVHLPCFHRFHWSCVVPWIEANSHCPCCRTCISLASLDSC